MKYYIIAGEASGDLHGSNLIKGLITEDKEAQIRFWGGDLMLTTGAQMVVHYKDTAVMGIADVLAKLGKILSRLSFCKKDILEWKPDVVILIDYPGFNMKIAEFCHQNGIKVFYYIAPKTWASRENRNKKIKAWVDKLFIVFPFEIPYFQKAAIPFIYEGNPLIDAIDNHNFSRPCPSKYIAILAGSRKGEISRMLPVCMEVVDKLSALAEYSDYKFIIAGAPARSIEDYKTYIADRSNVRLYFGKTYDILKYADAAIINSGTASLEAALIGTVQVVGWSTTRLTYLVAKHIFKVLERIKYISLGNLCIDKLAFRELIQYDYNSDNVAAELRRLIEDQSYRETMLADYDAIRNVLGGSGASRKVARAMINELR